MLPLTSQHVLGALGTGVTKSFAVGSFPGVGGAVWGRAGGGWAEGPWPYWALWRLPSRG